MQPKPMQFATEYAEVFQDQSVVEAYDLRLPYPAPTFEILLNLLPVRPVECAVLDAGCGTGIVARALALAGATVDAVDFSAAMIAKGRTLPGGDSPRLT